MAAAGQPAQVTQLLRAWRDGDRAALDELMPIVYAELRRIAAGYLRRERAGATLRPTELVAEAYLRLADAAAPELVDRVHFFAVAARNMRQLLVDRARRRLRGKRGAGAQAISFDDRLVGGQRDGELVALDDALQALTKLDERMARVIELHYFGGMSQAEIAEALDVHVNTVAKDLKLATAWIHRALRSGT